MSLINLTFDAKHAIAYLKRIAEALERLAYSVDRLLPLEFGVDISDVKPSGEEDFMVYDLEQVWHEEQERLKRDGEVAPQAVLGDWQEEEISQLGAWRPAIEVVEDE